MNEAHSTVHLFRALNYQLTSTGHLPMKELCQAPGRLNSHSLRGDTPILQRKRLRVRASPLREPLFPSPVSQCS